MVTIDPDKSISAITELKKSKALEKTGTREFDAIFRQAIDIKGAEYVQMESTSSIADIRPAQFETQKTPSASMIVDQVRHLLDTMEAYQQKMIENGATLKEIEPLMDQLAGQSETLTAISKDVGEDDDLKTIINKSLMLSSVEIARFRSGIYNDE